MATSSAAASPHRFGTSRIAPIRHTIVARLATPPQGDLLALEVADLHRSLPPPLFLLRLDVYPIRVIPVHRFANPTAEASLRFVPAVLNSCSPALTRCEPQPVGPTDDYTYVDKPRPWGGSFPE